MYSKSTRVLLLFAALAFGVVACDSGNRAIIDHRPVENFIGETKSLASDTYGGATLTRDEYHKEEDLYFKEWSYVPKSDELYVDASNLPTIGFFVREKKGYITMAERSFEPRNTETLKSIYTAKAAVYTQRFGTPKCMGSGVPGFFRGEEPESMNVNRIADPLYVANCEPAWFIDMKEGTQMILSISAGVPLYTIDSIEEIERIEVSSSVSEEDKYLEIKNR